jgi:hypothetical protein
MTFHLSSVVAGSKLTDLLHESDIRLEKFPNLKRTLPENRWGFFVGGGFSRNSVSLFIHGVWLTGNEVNFMGCRQNLRVDCYSSCILDFAGNDYHAKLVNISPGGALISVENDVLMG